jgi:dolichyl-phosphate-mannose-protein mannosyltransferase
MTHAHDRSASTVAWLAAAVTFLIHLVANPHYGFFRDELYFIICGFHPDWGYVDQPPLVPLMSAATQLFGHSLVLLRAVPALFAAAAAFTTCRLVTEYGGGVFAQALAALVLLFTGVSAAFGGKVGTDEVGLWTWPLLALLIVRLSKGADPRWWLAAGAAAGVSLESKYSVIFFVVAILVGTLLTPARRILFTRWFALGCALAMLIALPNFVWQARHGFPMLELLQNGQNGKNLIASPLLFLVQQIVITTPPLAPVWMIGLVWLLRTAQVRYLGYAYVILIAEMLVLHGKHYYPAAVYPILIAAGAVPLEAWTRSLRAARAVLVAYAVVFGLAFLPFALPILPEETFVAYEAKLSTLLPLRGVLATEHERETSTLPGDWADMHGWPELAATVKRVYDGLPPNDRAQAVVLADNYGTAAAIDFFTPGVPVISIHNQYWMWGTKGYGGNVLVQVGGSCFAKQHLFASRTVVTTFSSRWGIGWEQHLPIAICRGIRTPLAEVWKTVHAFE